MNERMVQLKKFGLIEYDAALSIQKSVLEKVRNEELSDTILIVEHPHTFTTTRSSNPNDILFNEDELRAKEISVHEIERGGEITYHGFGQLVVYPILNLNHYYLDAHRYLRDLEEVVIRVLHEYQIEAKRKTHPDPKKNFTGVWVGEEKICAIGVKFSKWTTMHGLALNVNPDLDYFAGIVPCGIKEKGVTSIEKILAHTVSLDEITDQFITHFETVFGVKITEEVINHSAFPTNSYYL